MCNIWVDFKSMVFSTQQSNPYVFRSSQKKKLSLVFLKIQEKCRSWKYLKMNPVSVNKMQYRLHSSKKNSHGCIQVLVIYLERDTLTFGHTVKP